MGIGVYSFVSNDSARSPRPAHRSENGALRWNDDGKKVCLFVTWFQTVSKCKFPIISKHKHKQ